MSSSPTASPPSRSGRGSCARSSCCSAPARPTTAGRVLDLPGEGTFDLDNAESPRFTGRAVVALATDPDVMKRSGRAFNVADLARDYGFTDVNGKVPQVRLRDI